jgi:hypothetical protein
MSWGCYRHECDIESTNAQKALALLVNHENQRGFPAWGHDEQICPFCYAELLDFAQRALVFVQQTFKTGEISAWGGPLGLTDLKRDGEALLANKHGLGEYDPDSDVPLRIVLDILDDDDEEAT